MRLFIALPLPERTKDNLQRTAEQLRHFATEGNFVPKQNYHVTLHFLGEVADDDIIYVQAAMDELKDFPAMTLALSRLAVLRPSNVVCVKFRPDKQLDVLHEKLGSELEKRGFTVEHRAFRPHVSVIRKGVFTLPFSETSKNATVYNMPFECDTISLFKSDLCSEGTVYTELYSVDLAKID